MPSSYGVEAHRIADGLRAVGGTVSNEELILLVDGKDEIKSSEDSHKTCRYYITLMTFGWQTSDECQKETRIVKNRSSNYVTIIPFFTSE